MRRSIVPGTVLGRPANHSGPEEPTKRVSTRDMFRITEDGDGNCRASEYSHSVDADMGVAARSGHSENGVSGNGSTVNDADKNVVDAGRVSRRCTCPCLCGSSSSAGAQGSGDSYGSMMSATTNTDGAGRFVRVGHACADLSRVEQLVGGSRGVTAMVRGCALGVEFIVRASERFPGLTVTAALDTLDEAMRDEGDENGVDVLLSVANVEDIAPEKTAANEAEGEDSALRVDGLMLAALAKSCCRHLVAKPRRFEVAAVLHRLPDVRFKRAFSPSDADVLTLGAA